MAATGTIAIVAAIGGVTINKVITKTFDHPNPYVDIALAAGKAASAWVKTDADTAACNLTAGHGYTNGKCDVYWATGVRYDVDMVVSTNALALDGGAGDNFPESAEANVVVCKPQQINVACDGDEVVAFVANSTTRAHLYFEDASGDSIAAIELQADEPSLWHDTNGLANPLTGDPITVCYASNGSATAGVLNIVTGEDSTP
jgi:hypothetical protein